MVNDLIIVEKIEQRLRERREPSIFPLSPTHRRELRKLREQNVGQLSEQLRNIKVLKKEEYIKKYSSQIERKLSKKQKICTNLNKDWELRVVKIQKLLQERKELEESMDICFLDINHDYSDMCNLRRIDETKREFSFDKKRISEKIAEEEFNIKYNKNFSLVQTKIDDIVTKYEEAINFGDLEIVKELYYIMKTSDKLFKRISELVI